MTETVVSSTVKINSEGRYIRETRLSDGSVMRRPWWEAWIPSVNALDKEVSAETVAPPLCLPEDADQESFLAAEIARAIHGNQRALLSGRHVEFPPDNDTDAGTFQAVGRVLENRGWTINEYWGRLNLHRTLGPWPTGTRHA